MTNDTKLSDLTVGEFKALMRECLQQDIDAEKEVERLYKAFIINPTAINCVAYNEAVARKVQAYDRDIKNRESLNGSFASLPGMARGRDE